MTRWFRFYEDAVNDPKVQRLEPKLFKAWVNMLCLASKNEGWLPEAADVAFTLRVTEAEAGRLVDGLVSSGLLDEYDGRFTPHNWNGRQYKSDVSTERVKQHRKRKRNVSQGVSETPPETEQKQIQNSVASATGADAPIDHRKRLFSEGLAKLSTMTGKGPDACRSFVGKCLRDCSDDAITVLGLIEDAERNRVADPSAWITARLPGASNGKPRSQIIQAADDIRRKIASFDGPTGAPDAVRSGEGAAAPRLLSHG